MLTCWFQKDFNQDRLTVTTQQSRLQPRVAIRWKELHAAAMSWNFGSLCHSLLHDGLRVMGNTGAGWPPSRQLNRWWEAYCACVRSRYQDSRLTAVVIATNTHPVANNILSREGKGSSADQKKMLNRLDEPGSWSGGTLIWAGHPCEAPDGGAIRLMDLKARERGRRRNQARLPKRRATAIDASKGPRTYENRTDGSFCCSLPRCEDLDLDHEI